MLASFARSARLFLLPQRLKRTLELEAVLQQRQIHVERLGANRLDLADDSRQRLACQCVCNSLFELLGIVRIRDMRNSASPRHASQIGPGRGGGGKAANREQACIVEDDM